MRVLVRADGGSDIGLGHVVRCLSLSARLRARGAEVVFVTSPSDEGVLARIEAAGCGVLTYPKGASEDEAIAFLLKTPGDLVVADSYRVTLAHQKAIKAAGRRLLAVDDFGTGEFAADFIFNPNLVARPENYAAAPGTRFLLGPRHALLRPEFAAAAARPPEKSSPPRVLVTMGGADPSGLTRGTWKALDALPAEFSVDLLAGAANKDVAALAKDVPSARHATTLHHDPSDVAGLMKKATLAVSAAGSTCWELACLGVPAIVIVAADNQQGVAEGLVKSGFAAAAGPDLARTAAALLADPARLMAMSAAGRALVDGRGAERVAEAVLA